MKRQGGHGLLARLAISAVLLVAPVTALAAQVEGRIVDADGAGVAVAVVLEVHDGQEIVYQRVSNSNDDGVASWTEVPEADGLNARIRATYDGAEYLDPSFLRVLQFMTISNAGDAAFAGGPQLADGRSAGIVIPLPAGATNVSPAPFPNAEEALNPAHAQFDSDRILDARPVPADGRQVAVTYELSLTAGNAEASLLLPYPTQNVSLLLGGEGAQALTLRSEQLRSEQAEMIGDQQYQLWVARALQPGTELTFTIAPPGLTLTTGQVGLLVAAAGLLLAVVGSFVGGGSTEYRAEQRLAVIAAVAALDDSHEAGDISDGDYFYRRGREFDRLALLDAGEEAAKRVSA